MTFKDKNVLKSSNKVYKVLSLNFEEKIYKKSIHKEGHCVFFNAAHAIFSNAKHYLLLRYVVSMFYNILSKMSTMDETSTRNSWLTNNLYYDIPQRLAEFFFNDNLPFDEGDHIVEQQIMANASKLFEFEIVSVRDYFDKIMNWTSYQKKPYYIKLQCVIRNQIFMVLHQHLLFLVIYLVFGLE